MYNIYMYDSIMPMIFEYGNAFEMTITYVIKGTKKMSLATWWMASELLKWTRPQACQWITNYHRSNY